MSTGKIPQDDRGKAVLALWNDATQQAIPVHVGALVTGSDGKTYARLDVNATVTNAQALGQTTKIASTSVTIASDQSSPTNPLTTEKSVMSAARASLAFVASTGDLAITVAAFQAVSFWNPSGSGKVAHLVRLAGLYGVTATHPVFFVYKETSDPSTGWTSTVTMTPVCVDLGSGNTSVLTVTRSNTGQSQSTAGTLLWVQDAGSTITTEILAPGIDQEFKIPPNSGLTIYINAINTSHYSLDAFWFEATV